MWANFNKNSQKLLNVIAIHARIYSIYCVYWIYIFAESSSKLLKRGNEKSNESPAKSF